MQAYIDPKPVRIKKDVTDIKKELDPCNYKCYSRKNVTDFLFRYINGSESA